MRQKSTIYSPEFHNQFEGSKEDILHQKKLLKERMDIRDKKEGQSKFRVSKKLKPKG